MQFVLSCTTRYKFQSLMVNGNYVVFYFELKRRELSEVILFPD